MTVHLELPPGLVRGENWRVFAFILKPYPVPPPADAQSNPAAVQAWQAIPEVKAARELSQQFTIVETTPGTLVCEDLPAGNYTLSVSVQETLDGGAAGKPRAQAIVAVTIPPDAPVGKIDIGNVLLQPVP